MKHWKQHETTRFHRFFPLAASPFPAWILRRKQLPIFGAETIVGQKNWRRNNTFAQSRCQVYPSPSRLSLTICAIILGKSIVRVLEYWTVAFLGIFFTNLHSSISHKPTIGQVMYPRGMNRTSDQIELRAEHLAASQGPKCPLGHSTLSSPFPDWCGANILQTSANAIGGSFFTQEGLWQWYKSKVCTVWVPLITFVAVKWTW